MNNNKTKVNSLTQFIGYYNSDEDEDDNISLNGTEDVNTDANEKRNKSTDWTTCYAKDSGHPYYWNTRTREVTWEMPDEYKVYMEHIRNNYNIENLENNVKNWVECPSDDNGESYYVNKITRIVSWDKPTRWVSSSSDVSTISIAPTNKTKAKSKPAIKNKSRFKDKSDIDEKIELINYYAEKTDSSSDEESNKRKKSQHILITPTVVAAEVHPESLTVSTKLSQKIYSLKHDLHPDSLKISPLNQNVSNSEEIKNILLATSTVAETEDNVNDPLNRDPETSPTTVLINDNTETELFDAKLFKRKKRIEFLPKVKELIVSSKTLPNNDEIESKSINNDPDKVVDPSNDKETNTSNSVYSSLIKGTDAADDSNDKSSNDKINIDLELKMNIKDLSGIMKDKLKFLSESTSPATSAQVMFIQFDTLMTAYESQNLNEIYLLKWLKETNATLEQLEKEAVPDVWKCEWDRSSSRYFYENLLTGKKQWDFPVDDISPSCDEKIGVAVAAVTSVEKIHNGNDEMDISTTPPPPVECDVNNISLNENRSSCIGIEDPMIPKTPPPPIISEKPNDSLGSELESFYSDLASIEQITSNNITSEVTNTSTTPVLELHSSGVSKVKREAPNAADLTEPAKKKSKKLKVTGISTKMKDISGMVAKWQKVQRDLSN